MHSDNLFDMLSDIPFGILLGVYSYILIFFFDILFEMYSVMLLGILSGTKYSDVLSGI